jgi:hypothetical protein
MREAGHFWRRARQADKRPLGRRRDPLRFVRRSRRINEAAGKEKADQVRSAHAIPILARLRHADRTAPCGGRSGSFPDLAVKKKFTVIGELGPVSVAECSG